MNINISSQWSFVLAAEFAKTIKAQTTYHRLHLTGCIGIGEYKLEDSYLEMQAAIRSLTGYERSSFIGSLRYMLGLEWKKASDERGPVSGERDWHKYEKAWKSIQQQLKAVA